MKHLQITTRIDERLLPPLYSAVSESAAVSELRVLDWNLAADDVGTLLYAVDGDADRFRRAAEETDGIEETTLTRPNQSTSYALLSARPDAIPFLSTFMAVTARANLVVRKPLVYRDGQSRGFAVGDSEALQAAVDETPPGVDVEIEQIARFPAEVEDPSRVLSERQRGAVETAVEMGYYRQPREATHADIAAALECAPNTVTTHLQRAEAKLVPAVMRSVCQAEL